MSREVCRLCGDAFGVDGSHICPNTKFKIAAPQPSAEPVAMRGDFDGYGYQYIDNGSGSNWRSRHPDWEPLYTHPQPDDTALLRERLGETK